ncbi:MAG: hypothetical protein U5P41_02645 [Gammaproteobacteria bacterium]|nr:hypothetical protein [Gammaproteobacteria bacterium]
MPIGDRYSAEAIQLSHGDRRTAWPLRVSRQQEVPSICGRPRGNRWCGQPDRSQLRRSPVPVTTRNLAQSVRKARAALGEESFNVVTIGFDPPQDNPETMAAHARQQGVSDPGWAFLSGSRDTVRNLMTDIGFSYWRAPKGYDHLTQTTIIDSDGVIYAQVYGELVDLPQLVEPLKRLVFDIDNKQDSMVDSIIKRVSYFCTDYDPVTGAYKFDYSPFLGMIIGAVIIASVIGFLVVNVTAHRRRNAGRAVQFKPDR